MQVIKIPSACGRPKNYSGLKVIFHDGTSITFTAVQLMSFIRRNYREDQNLSKYSVTMINEIRKAFNLPPLKYKTYGRLKNVFFPKIYQQFYLQNYYW